MPVFHRLVMKSRGFCSAKEPLFLSIMQELASIMCIFEGPLKSSDKVRFFR